MKQLLLMGSDGSVKQIETPAPATKGNYYIAETAYSTVIAETERGLTAFRGIP